jgi:hypothetical protein
MRPCSNSLGWVARKQDAATHLQQCANYAGSFSSLTHSNLRPLQAPPVPSASPIPESV